MNHQPYKHWIVMDQELDSAQQQELEQHLKTCSSCRALSNTHREVNQLLNTSTTPLPRAGFTERWKERLAAREQAQKRKIAGLTVIILLLSMLLTLSTLGVQVFAFSDRLPHIFLQITRELVNWVLFAGQLKNIFTPLVRVGVKLIPPTWYFVAGIGLPIVFFAWLFTLSDSLVTIRRYPHENAN